MVLHILLSKIMRYIEQNHALHIEKYHVLLSCDDRLRINLITTPMACKTRSIHFITFMSLGMCKK